MTDVPRPDLVKNAQWVIGSTELSGSRESQIIRTPQQGESVRKSTQTVIQTYCAQKIMAGVATVSKALFQALPCFLGAIELKQLMTRHEMKLVRSDSRRQVFGKAAQEP
jgi:hypothetical protein